jgi:hypothetical protein
LASYSTWQVTPRPHRLAQATQESDEIGLLLFGQFQLQHEVEELNRIFQGETTTVVKVRRTFLDAPKREARGSS